MDVQDLIFNPDIPRTVKDSILDIMDAERTSDPYLKVLKPTASNDDVNGSQHASNGGTDFTYEDATASDVETASTLGYYEYFGDYGYQTYTGHYYNGSDRKFAAIVIDPPAYAVTVTL